MNALSGGPLVYLGILAAATIEGEVAYIAAAALVAAGRLNPIAVLLCGATGASIGDQFYFYVMRGRLNRWLERFPAVARRAAPLVAHVRRHSTAMVLLIRFAPGLRIALAAACVCAEVAPITFSLLNALAALLWAAGLLVIVAWGGPNVCAALGLTGWQAALVAGVVVVALLHLAGRVEARVLAGPVRVQTKLKP